MWRRLLLLLLLIVVAGATTACARLSRMHAPTPSPVPGADLARGKLLYASNCAACHGISGKGSELGPSLIEENRRRTYAWVRAQIADPEPPMPKLYPSRMTKGQLRDVAAYVESL